MTAPRLLTENDPSPITLQEGSSHVIFTGPHNGIAVPEHCDDHLGFDPQWFRTAHQSHDLHIQKVFDALQIIMPDASYLYGNYSRLVCDLNIVPEYAIPRTLTEVGKEIQPNHPTRCCDNKASSRMQDIYWPYHNALEDLVTRKRRQHGGIIVLDLHSFTPTWQNDKRPVEIGTIRPHKTPFSIAYEQFLRHNSHGYSFISGQPYRLQPHCDKHGNVHAGRTQNAAFMTAKTLDLQWLGLEIRNDLIATDDGVLDITRMIADSIAHIQIESQSTPAITAPLNEAMAHITLSS